eukprot:TRINITY_DN35389_c0_g1_i1.p1 TRINITY_DN35389_c0_g1~~TRINITY_DN35389_c0_g1_i1.p1  ORF type:complete len:1732 (+),score=262.90 TRINITY_DN35389_c0_g1_i1:183-5378(+)
MSEQADDLREPLLAVEEGRKSDSPDAAEKAKEEETKDDSTMGLASSLSAFGAGFLRLLPPTRPLAPRADSRPLEPRTDSRPLQPQADSRPSAPATEKAPSESMASASSPPASREMTEALQADSALDPFPQFPRRRQVSTEAYARRAAVVRRPSAPSPTGSHSSSSSSSSACSLLSSRSSQRSGTEVSRRNSRLLQRTLSNTSEHLEAIFPRSSSRTNTEELVKTAFKLVDTAESSLRAMRHSSDCALSMDEFSIDSEALDLRSHDSGAGELEPEGSPTSHALLGTLREIVAQAPAKSRSSVRGGRRIRGAQRGSDTAARRSLFASNASREEALDIVDVGILEYGQITIGGSSSSDAQAPRPQAGAAMSAIVEPSVINHAFREAARRPTFIAPKVAGVILEDAVPFAVRHAAREKSDSLAETVSADDVVPSDRRSMDEEDETAAPVEASASPEKAEGFPEEPRSISREGTSSKEKSHDGDDDASPSCTTDAGKEHSTAEERPCKEISDEAVACRSPPEENRDENKEPTARTPRLKQLATPPSRLAATSEDSSATDSLPATPTGAAQQRPMEDASYFEETPSEATVVQLDLIDVCDPSEQDKESIRSQSQRCQKERGDSQQRRHRTDASPSPRSAAELLDSSAVPEEGPVSLPTSPSGGFVGAALQEAAKARDDGPPIATVDTPREPPESTLVGPTFLIPPVAPATVVPSAAARRPSPPSLLVDPGLLKIEAEEKPSLEEDMQELEDVEEAEAAGTEEDKEQVDKQADQALGQLLFEVEEEMPEEIPSEMLAATISGTLWKKRSKYSRVAKVYRLLQKEAQAVLSGEDWLGNLQLNRMVSLARQVVGLVGSKSQHRALVDTAAAVAANVAAQTKEEADETKPVGTQAELEGPGDERGDEEALWSRRFFWLLGSTLSWAKHSYEEDPAHRNDLGPLWGSSVELLATTEYGRHVIRIYPTPRVRRRPLALAMETAEEAARWMVALQHACRYPLPQAPREPPPPLRCIGRLDEFCCAHGPPDKHVPPPARLRLEVLSATGFPAPGGGQAASTRSASNPFILAHLENRQFRTATRYQSTGQAVFGQAFTVPVEFEDADASLKLEAYHEPEYEDHDHVLLGTIAVPLWTMSRNQRTEMILPLRMASTTRAGAINASYGKLAIAVTLRQPLGYLWLPADPLLENQPAEQGGPAEAPSQTPFSWEDLEMQISRIVALADLIILWHTKIATILMWEYPCYSFAWFCFFEVWVLFAWKWTLTILAVLLLRLTLYLRPRTMGPNWWAASSAGTQASGASGDPRSIQQPPGVQLDSDAAGAMVVVQSSSARPRPGRLGDGMSSALLGAAGGTAVAAASAAAHAREDASEERSQTKMPQAEVPDAWLWEAERRVILAGFSADYLHDFDPPRWMDTIGRECPGPNTVVQVGEKWYRFRWKVVVSEETDENGWQYAPTFRSNPWHTSYDAMQAWVRRRRHHGRCLGAVEEGDAMASVASMADDMVALGLETSAAAADVKSSSLPTGAAPLEEMITENKLLRRYTQLYLVIRNDVDLWVRVIEKHLNLFTWKDRSVTIIVASLLFLAAILALWVPTSWVIAFLIGLAFYIGFLTGIEKRQKRDELLENLTEWCGTVCRSKLTLRSSDMCSKLEEHGITRLALRNWCNQSWRAGLDLRAVDQCETLAEFADLVILSSPMLNKAPRRYRAWHSSLYFNFMDHVPSDVSEHDIGSLCYRAPIAASLPFVHA